jgi:hypothetical protein
MLHLLLPSSVSRTASLLLAAGLFAACTEMKSRTLPEESEKDLSTEFPEFDTIADPARTASMRRASDNQILLFRGGLDADYHSRFTHDPRLDVVANIMSRAFADSDTSPSYTLVEWVMWRLGITGQIVDRSGWIAQWRNQKRFLDDVLRKEAVEFPKEFDVPPSGQSYSFGIARFREPPWGYCQSHIVIENRVLFERLRKRYEIDEEIRFQGRISIPNDDTYFVMSVDGPEALYMPIKVAKDGAFDFRVPGLKRPGRYMAEMRTRTDPPRNVRVFGIPIYVGVNEPALPDASITSPQINPWGMDTWARHTADMLNAHRAANGLPPLNLHERASAAAAVEAKRDVEHWYLPLRPVRKVLQEAGVHVSRADDFWTSFELLDESFSHLLEMPWFNAATLDDRYTDVGIGFAKDEECECLSHTGIVYLFNGAGEQRKARDAALGAMSRPVETYGGPPPEPTATDGFAALLAQQLDAATEVPIVYDPRLDALAAAYAAYGDLDINSDLERWMRWKIGETGNLFHVARRLSRGSEVSPFFIAAVKAKVENDEDDAKNHYAFGVARVPQGGDTVLEIAVIVSREVELDPFPKHYKSGEKLIISGKFTSKPENADILVSFDEGMTSSSALELNPGGAFGYSITAPSSPGPHLVEITVPDVEVDDEAVYFHRRRVMLVPIWVDTAEPATPPPAYLSPRKNPEDQASWGDTVLGIYNAERAAHKLPPLRRNRVADAVLADQLLLARSTLQAPTFWDMQRQLGTNLAGYALSTSGNVDYLGNDLVAGAERLLAIPSWREEILSPETTMFGFAVDADGFVTMEMFLADESQDTDRHPADESRTAVALAPRREQLPIIRKLNGDVLAEVAKKNVKDVGACFNRIAEHEDEFGGRVALSLAVGPLGDAIAVTIETSTVEAEDVETCIARAVRGWKFPLSVDKGVGFGSLGFELAGEGKRRKIKIY